MWDAGYKQGTADGWAAALQTLLEHCGGNGCLFCKFKGGLINQREQIFECKIKTELARGSD
jgi:hypothetical protein